MKLLNIKQTSKGTTRFTVLGSKQGFYRLRKVKSRWGFDRGECFTQLHLGKLTVALERKSKLRSLFQFSINA